MPTTLKFTILMVLLMFAAVGIAACGSNDTTYPTPVPYPTAVPYPTPVPVATPIPSPTPTPIPAAPASFSLTPSEDCNPIRTQHVQLVQVRTDSGDGAAGNRVEWFINRFPEAVGDIVSVSGKDPNKVDNYYALVRADEKGETRLTITATRPGDTDITALVPGIEDQSIHKQFAVKHWLDLTAEFPDDATNLVGTEHAFTVKAITVSGGSPVEGVPVRWTIIDGPPAHFTQGGASARTVTVLTNGAGLATATIAQDAPARGTNRINIDVLCLPQRLVMLTKEVSKKYITGALIQLSKTGSAQEILGSEFTYSIEASNPSDSPATSFKLVDRLPEGLAFVRANPAATATGNQVAWDLGRLEADGTANVQLTVRGVAGGTWENVAVASFAEGDDVEARASTRILVPAVAIQKTGPSGVFIARDRVWTLTVSNSGDTRLGDVTVRDAVPEGLSFVSAQPAGSASGRNVTWNLGSLDVGQSRDILVTLRGEREGAWTNVATVETAAGVGSRAELPIQVLAAPGVTAPITDTDDPIQVGERTTYQIKVTSQSRFALVNNVRIVGLIPDKMEFVSASGPAPFTVVGKEVRFSPVATLTQGQSIDYAITVVARDAGQVVFSSTLSYDEFAQPIVSQEGTTIFGEQ